MKKVHAVMCAVLLGFTFAGSAYAAEQPPDEMIVAMASSKSVCGGNTGRACPGDVPVAAKAPAPAVSAPAPSVSVPASPVVVAPAPAPPTALPPVTPTPANTGSANNTPPQASQISADTSDVDPATAGLQFYENTTVKYSGSASDADGDTLNWKWIYTKNGGPEITYIFGTGAVQPATFTYGTGTAGIKYHWILRVDDKKATTESALDVSIISKPVVPTTPTPITKPTSTPAPTSVSPVTSAAIPTTGLVGYWKFDEGLGGTASDSSGNGNAGALTNGPAWASGKVGQALSFDGVNDYVRAEDSASLDLTTAVTLSVWAKFNAMPTGSTAMSLITKTEGASYGIITNEGGSARIETYFHVGGSYVNAGESLSNLSAGQWYHFAATFDGTATKFYRDGVLKQTVTKSGTLSTNNEPLTIGANPDSQGRNFMEFFNGAIDEVRVYNRALSSQEVTDLYTAESGGTSVTPVPTPTPAPSTPAASISTYMVVASPTSVNAGASVTATWAAPSGSSAKDWVGLYKVGDPNNSFGKWVYTGGLPSGTFTTTIPGTGSYEFRYLLNDGFTDVARSSAMTGTAAPVVVSPPAPSPTPAATLDFSLINNGSKSVNPGQSAVNGITATQTLNGVSAQTITFTTSGLPSGTTYSYAPGACTMNCSTTLTINTSSSTPMGTYTIIVSADGGSATRKTQFTMNVVAPGTAASGTYYLASGVNGINANGQPIPAGDDKNSGTDINHPFKTIRHAVQVLKPGETLLVRGGEYDTVNGLICDVTHSLTSECPVHSDYLIPSGTSWDKPVTVKGYQGDFTKAYAADPAQRPNDTPRPILRRYIASTVAAGGGSVYDSSATDYQMARVSPAHMPLYDECVAWWNSHPPQGRNFPHDCWDGSGNQITGLWLQAGAYGLLNGAVVNVATRYRAVEYIILDGIDIDAEGTTINALTHSCYQVCGENGGSYDGPRHMRYQNMEIRNSLASCHNNPGVDESVIEDFQFINVNIHHCGVAFDTNMVGGILAREHPEARFFHPWYMHGGGNTLIGSETSHSAGTALGPAGINNIIEGNYFHDNNAGVYIDGNNWRLCNNVFYNNGSIDLYHRTGRNATVCNNTIVSGPVNPAYSQWGIYLAGNSSASLYENNIIVSPIGVNNDSWGQAHTFRNNLIKKTPSWHSSYEFLEQYGVAVIKQNNILGQDPKLVNPAGGDFHLQAGSPAIDKGSPNSLSTDKDGNARPRGNGIDIGAYEFGN